MPVKPARAGRSAGAVIIGAGHGGVEAAAALAVGGWSKPIHLISDENCLPYQRPPLSKDYLANPGSPLPLRSTGFFADKGITIHLGVRAQAINRRERTVVLSDGTLAYEHLVLATGARNRIPVTPGLDSTAMVQLRSLADADTIVRQISGWKRVLVVGGGFIGLEAAGLFPKLGIKVDVVEMAPRLMQRAASPRISEWFLRYHLAHDVGMHMPDGIGALRHSATGVHARLTSGREISADALLIAVGVVPNVELAQAAGLAVLNGIVVDETLLTSDPSISAIGDCASFPNYFCGSMTRMESVQNAAHQARNVASRLMGKPAPYREVPWFWSIQGEARLQIAGLHRPGLTEVVRGDPSSGKFSVFLHDRGQLVAVESLNSPADHMAARRFLASPVVRDWSVVADPAFDLRELTSVTLGTI